MTLIEASKRFNISIDKLKFYEENQLITCETFVNGVPDYTEDELHKAGVIHALLKAGMDVTALRKYLKLLHGKIENKEEQIRILRKQRYQLLDEIHCKQQCLDELDYMIDEIRKGKGAR